jgi:hypothetical protein
MMFLTEGQPQTGYTNTLLSPMYLYLKYTRLNYNHVKLGCGPNQVQLLWLETKQIGNYRGIPKSLLNFIWAQYLRNIYKVFLDF